jgi:hypothetical protein
MIALPRHVIGKKLASGTIAYYYNVPTRYRRLACPIPNEALGSDFANVCKRAETLNGLFDEWDAARKGLPVTGIAGPKIGSVDWLFREYRQSKAYTEKVELRSRRDYEWAMQQLCDATTKKGDRIGTRPIKSITPRGADKLYELLLYGPNGKRPRTAEKIVKLCRKAWRVVHRLFPGEFNKDLPNPWLGVTLESRVKAIKPSVTREQVYAFAHGCIEHGEPEVAAVAVICFEWLQRPENVIGGHIKWTDYRSPSAPTIIRVAHHKTGTIAPHPLEELGVDGSIIKFYADAEEVLAQLPRRGVPMVLREVSTGIAKPYAFSSMQHIVQRMRKKLGLPEHFTLDACRHGGMTELEEAELTDGQGRALSTHKTQQSYEGYAKRTAKRMLSATRKRYAHRLAHEHAQTDAILVESFGKTRSA